MPFMKFRFLLVSILLTVLVSAGLSASPALGSPAQTAEVVTLGAATAAPGHGLMPMVGEFTLWCTWSNPGGDGICRGAREHHTTPALDLAAPVGEPVFAAADGKVIQADSSCGARQNDGCNNGSGNVVSIDQGSRRSRYLHLATVEVGIGPISAGDRIGTTGNSGSTGSPHLHYDEVTDETYGDRIKPGKILACHGDKVVTYPNKLGVTSWGDAPYGSVIRNDGYGCLIPGWTEPASKPKPTPPPPTGRYVALSPTRLFDTRLPSSPFGRLEAGESASAAAAQAVGVPGNAIAVVMNVTAVDADDSGYLTVWPAGTTRPTTSSLNVAPDRDTVANLVTVPIGTNNSVSFHPSVGMDVVADVAGYYLPASGKQSAGRFMPMSPTRLLDTRSDDAINGGDRTVNLKVAGTDIVPANAQAVVVNLTATESVANGFVTAWPTGSRRPLASNLNPTGKGDTVPNMAIVAVGKGGHISMFSSKRADLIVDITGYITGKGAEANRSGLFVPVRPYRWFDTRDSHSSSGTIAPQNKAVVPISRAGQLPLNIGALALNVTATDARDRGYVTVWPSALPRPLASTLNLARPLDTRPNASYLPLGAGDAMSFYSQSGTDLVTDVFGYFTP
jgi:hypothetical protein